LDRISVILDAGTDSLSAFVVLVEGYAVVGVAVPPHAFKPNTAKRTEITRTFDFI
jgi:hypothetical protein